MSTRILFRLGRFAVVTLLVAAAWTFSSDSASGFGGGFGNNNRAVGGVMVDAEGVLRAATVDETRKLIEARQQQLKQISGDMNVATPLRKVSLRRFQEEYKARKAAGKTPYVTQDMEYLSGLTRIQYVFVYPEEKDIVLVGPAEPMTISKNGHMVGKETGRPILQLDHLLEALRTAESARQEAITCSIDPTPEGVVRLNNIIRKTTRLTQSRIRLMEKAMGLQIITITGVSASSDFARTMVAADYRMKRLAMGFDKSKVRGMRNYLTMMSTRSPASPRWWMAPNYDAILKDPQGLAWELRGQGVKVMTEDTVFKADGKAKRIGKANVQAQRWADLMTAKYDELSVEYPIFGELRNVMDMAVIGALIVKENLREKAGLDMSVMMNDREIGRNDFTAPKNVRARVSTLKKNGRQIVTVSGGVDLDSWTVADRVKIGKSLSPTRKSAIHVGKKWWWN